MKNWFRVFGYGLLWTSAPPLYSERCGARRPFLRLGKVRVFALKRGA
jgi:hypothetical protein